MPGVPTSKGCEACRKAKKKCDELQPCTRCARLRLPCIGSGLRRYKFQSVELSRSAQGSKLQIAQVPNDTLTIRFISTLEIRDVRYDITYYGPFLRDLPRRFGSSPVLDAAATALVSSYPYFQKRDVPPAVLVKFGKAVKELRECLNNPVNARSPNTLCAIYLISICQSWIGTSQKQRSSHAEAIAHILRIIDMNEYKSGFARNLLVTLCVPVILEGMRDPRIRMNKIFWDQITALLHQSPPPPEHSSIPRPSIGLFSLAIFPKYIHNPSPYIPEITSTYLQLKSDAHKMHSYQKCGLLSTLPSVHQSRYQAACIVVSSLALLLNTVLHSFNLPDAMLIQESDFFIQTVIEGADVASRDRPLGAAYVPLCLIVALAAAKDPQQVSCIENILTDYQSDFKALEWRNCTKWLKTLLENHRRHGQLPEVGFEVDTSKLGVPGGCAMM
ncbi:hypothetical protein N7466_004869 [Penicillium verhagenii]|uniref:uncharacterized protein n=1 Tax=Penicillium verhagenii TaxID=1562060 RepID=UPI00254507FE|nr:uncharacterized protein N7466_004869 [Penicillium verhagenii]KAJ5935322.1 hypothetical protein N7466_004869 [Penicillium verhagenii]